MSRVGQPQEADEQQCVALDGRDVVGSQGEIGELMTACAEEDELGPH